MFSLLSSADDIHLSLSEMKELSTSFFSDEGETFCFVPTKGQHLFISDLQETVRKNAEKFFQD